MTNSTIVAGFTSRQVSDISGVPMSTLHYWATSGIVTPSIRGSEGRRVTRWWTLTELVSVRAVKVLRDAGCPLQTLRKAQAVLQSSWPTTNGATVLHWDGVDVLAVGEFGELRSMLQHPGQGVLHIVAVPIGAWIQESKELATIVDTERLEARRLAREINRVPLGERLRG